MDIEKVKEARKKLEVAVANLVIDFEKETETKISNVFVSSYNKPADEKVEIKVTF